MEAPVALTQQEEHIVSKIRKAKLFVFLRHHRHELFDKAFQKELASLYRKETRDQPPVAPAILALALILEAYMGSAMGSLVTPQAGSPWKLRDHAAPRSLRSACVASQ